jgi:glycerol-1-phosphate dehydrogenase [NAD(P)+]
MNISKLYKKFTNCSCKKEHICNIKAVEIGEGALNKLTALCEGYENILVVFDVNTYKICGQRITELLKSKNLTVKVLQPQEKVVIPNEQKLEEIENQVNDADLIIGVGSGVINDLCKKVSFDKNLPYFVIATAPSMDGYASVGSALILKNMKTTLNARPPLAIIADTAILKDAPLDMIKAGYGDIIGKFSCLNDWELSSFINGEYFCKKIYTEVYNCAKRIKRLGAKIKNRDPKAIGKLMEALVLVGVLMSFVGSSRPASGSEHHLSHYFEITGIISGKKYLPHGIDVFYSAAETAKLREKLLSLEAVPEKSSYDEAARVKDTKRIYGELADETLALQKKVGFYDGIDKRLSVYREKWDEIRSLLSKAPSFSEMEKILSDVRMNYSDFVDFYGIDRINDGILYAKDTKDRYTVLWMYYDIFSGKLEL